jgi:hypothetical protein
MEIIITRRNRRYLSTYQPNVYQTKAHPQKKTIRALSPFFLLKKNPTSLSRARIFTAQTKKIFIYLEAYAFPRRFGSLFFFLGA